MGRMTRSPDRLCFLSFSKASHVLLLLWCMLIASETAYARDITYTGAEEGVVFVKPGEPTQVIFPSSIEGGFKRKQSSIALEKQDNYLIIFAQPELSPEGEAILVHLDDKRTYSLRAIPSSEQHPRDGTVNIIDDRVPESSEEDASLDPKQPRDFAPPTIVSGLMRELILVAEFGNRKGITGYRRSNRYSGETVLHDGALKANIDEIFMGSDLWGYVLSVENLLDTTQRLNPATFRLDGTRAVTAQRWELAPRPLTAEQNIANAHVGKVYIVTKAKRR